MKLADVRFTSRDGALVATVSGEVDMSNAAQLTAALVEATPNEATGIVLDLSAVDYLDSAGIHLIYALREKLRTRGQDLKLVVPEESLVSSALRLAGVREHLHFVTAADDGIRDLGGGRD
jgi:anti-anti-sigma factor